jgi:Leucine-rich repeat (LRR) protein
MEVKKIKKISLNEYHLDEEELYLAHNNISTIPSSIHLMTKLTYLNLASNNIRNISHHIGSLINLKFLNLKSNKIRKIQKTMKNLTKLEYLNLENNEISEVPCEICNLCNLESLELSDNNILDLPEEMKNMTNLASLGLKTNNIKIIPSAIYEIGSLIKLDIDYNNIETISKDFFKLTNLRILYMTYNEIKEIPNEIEKLLKLKVLFLTNNKIKKIPVTIGKLTNLEVFDVTNNKIKAIPIEIINCRRMITFYYRNNEIEYMSPQVIRFLDRLRNPEIFEIYNDAQNVHNHSIQSSITESISKITNEPLKTNEEIIMNQILYDDILNTKTKELLIEYSDSDDYHSVLLITFKELLLHVWEIIEANDNKNEIKAILNNEILDSECKCFTGRLSRLVNCLNGFSHLIEIKISDNQQIGNVIVIIRNELIAKNSYSVEEHKKRVIEELKTRGYDDKIINEWIEEIE